jgi:hypothetical protein
MRQDLGFNLGEYLDVQKRFLEEQLGEEVNVLDTMLSYSKEEMEEYGELLERFKTTNASSASTNEKGLALENLVKFVIDKSVIFDGYQNLRTSSNEIDILVRLNPKGRQLLKHGLEISHEKFIAECKNYDKRIASTWVGKFASLMSYTQNSLGILFNYHGLSGSGWVNGTGLTKKLLLKDSKTYIIDFNIDDFNQLATGKSFNGLINDKIFAMSQDISINDLITEHPNQSQYEPEPSPN